MAERWFVPRYQDTTSQFQQGLIRGQTSQTSFGVNCRLLWIIENQSQFQNDLELKTELKPYLIWNDKAFHRNHHWPRQFPFYDKTSLKDLSSIIDRKDFKDFQNFVIHDQMKHFVLVEKQPTGWEDSNAFQTEPLLALNRFRLVLPSELNHLGETIWIGALKNVKKIMMKRNYDAWYLNTICHEQIDTKFQNPLDIVDGMLRRALEVHGGYSNSGMASRNVADSTEPDSPTIDVPSAPPILNENDPAILDDQPPPYFSVTNNYPKNN